MVHSCKSTRGTGSAMVDQSAFAAVKRETQASAVRVAHQPLPIGLDTRPFRADHCADLLTAPCEWTNSAPSFIFRNIALRDGGASYTQLKEIAEREYLSSNPHERTFPVERFASFLESAYRLGLLSMNFISPNGDIYSRERIVKYEISPYAQALLAQHAPAEVAHRAETTPAAPEVDTTLVRARLEPVIGYLTEHGATIRDTMVDALTQSESDDNLDAAWQRLEELIDEGIASGIIAREEDRLGAQVLSLVTTEIADTGKIVAGSL